MKNFVIMAMSRSGHHAVMNWIAMQMGGLVRHRSDPYPHVPDTDLKLPRDYSKRAFGYGRKNRKIGTGDTITGVVFTLGDFDVAEFRRYDLPNFREVQEHPTQFIISVRDPYNWLASNLAIGHDVSERRISIWKRQVEECLGRSDHLGGHPCVFFNYNRWFTDASYRQELAELLGLKFTDAGINEVPDYGNGSTWDKRNYHRRAQEMKVLERWKNVRENPTFLEITKDSELAELSEAYFNFANPLGV